MLQLYFKVFIETETNFIPLPQLLKVYKNTGYVLINLIKHLSKKLLKNK